MEVLCDIVFVFFCYCIFSGLFVFWYNDSVYINCCGMCNFGFKFKLKNLNLIFFLGFKFYLIVNSYYEVENMY